MPPEMARTHQGLDDHRQGMIEMRKMAFRLITGGNAISFSAPIPFMQVGQTDLGLNRSVAARIFVDV